MSTVDAANQIAQMQTQNAIYQAGQSKATGSAQKIDGNMYLQLMMEQLKYQDPMEPMDNTQFLTQQAQFSQVSSLENISESLAQNNSVMQTLSLVGKEVTMTDPDNPKNTITGKVEQANFSSSGGYITVNGKSYSTSSVIAVKDVASSTTTPTTNPAS